MLLNPKRNPSYAEAHVQKEKGGKKMGRVPYSQLDLEPIGFDRV